MRQFILIILLLTAFASQSQSIALQSFIEYYKFNHKESESPYSMVFHPKKELIAISTNFGSVRFINYKQDSIWKYNPVNFNGTPRLVFTPDGNEFIFTHYLSRSDIAIFDANTFQLKQNLKVDKENVYQVIMSGDGKSLMTTGAEGTIKVFTKTTDEWELFHEIIVPESDFIQKQEGTSVSFNSATGESRNGNQRDIDMYFGLNNFIFTSEPISKEEKNEKTLVRVFMSNAKKNRPIYETIIDGEIKTMQVHPNQENILVSTNREVIVYEWKNNQMARRRSFVDYSHAEHIAFDKIGKHVMISVYNSIKVCKWDNGNIKLNNDIDLYRSPSSMSFSADSKYFACAGWQSGALAWKTGLNYNLVENKKAPILQDKQKTGSVNNKTENVTTPESKGNVHLFTIGINNYKDYPVLSNAKKDAEDVKKVLLAKYKIDANNTKTLLDDQASSKNILDALNDYVENLNDDDQLIIYYSGHGHYNKSLDEGYWIPADAAKGKELDFFPNTTLIKYLKAIPAKHVFLVVDACFSGSLMSSGTRGFLDNVTQFRSRWALTSGRYEEVSDGLEGKNSPFASYFIKYLNENSKDRFAVSELVNYVKQAVSNNADQTPWGNAIRNAGDEGGEFIFELKK
jgi:hypothetical protein